MSKIKNMGTATMMFKEGIIISGSAANRDGTDSDYALIVTGSAVFDTRDGSSGNSGGVTIIKDEQDPVFIRFINDDDPVSWYAYMAMDSAENFYISPGRSQDFYIVTRENSGADYYYPIRIFDNGKIKIHQGAQSSSDSQTVLPADVVFSVSGSTSGTDGVSVFGGNVVVSGSLSMTGSSGLTSLNVYGNTNGSYVATIDNDQNSNGHVLKLSTDGNGSGSRILEMEDGDGDIVFRARADGRFGFGPDGVSSMGAGTFVVGIDNSSHTADIAISQRLQHLGDSNTYMDFPSNDNITFCAGGSEELKITDDAILVKQYIKHDGDENTHINFADNKIILKAGNLSFFKAEKKSSAPHEITLNDGSNNIDFVVKGNGSNGGNPGMKFDASTNKLGINGIGTPAYELEVAGDIGLAEYIYHRGDDNTYIRFQDDDINLQAGGRSMVKISEGTIDQVLIMSGGVATSPNVKSFTDTNFFVSGTIGSRGSSTAGTSVFGGDLFVSGVLHMGNAYQFPISDGTNNQVIKTDGNGNLSFTNQSGGGGGGNNLSLTALKTANYTASNWEMVLVNLVGAGGDVTVTLPAASSNEQVAIKIAGLAMGKEVIVDGNSSETIDGLVTRSMNTDYESMHLISDGSNWWRIS